ncbi:hypothetical protein ACLOJK_006704 [Asimina triloba]
MRGKIARLGDRCTQWKNLVGELMNQRRRSCRLGLLLEMGVAPSGRKELEVWPAIPMRKKYQDWVVPLQAGIKKQSKMGETGQKERRQLLLGGWMERDLLHPDGEKKGGSGIVSRGAVLALVFFPFLLLLLLLLLLLWSCAALFSAAAGGGWGFRFWMGDLRARGNERWVAVGIRIYFGSSFMHGQIDQGERD